MAKLSALPNQETIDEFKGLIDFYLYKGIPVARQWPRYRPRLPYPAEAAGQAAFAYINKAYFLLPLPIRAFYDVTATGTPLTGRDWLVRAFMCGIPY